ncbi:MAG: ATP-binding cassette domain-containing protein [Clostridiales bacterium]|nr:ATP-binding cassette domain-containing protein [Clostridiales bacterium]
MNVIDAINLKKSFNYKNEIIQAVNGVSLTISKGEVFGLLGPNGAGKTTTMRMLSTLIPIDEGDAYVAGYNVRKQPNVVRKYIGYVGQLGGADPTATGWENLMLAGRLYGMNHDITKKEAKKLVDIFELGAIIDRMPKTYSGGQKRRLELALGLIHKPDVLFLDEPTTGLDPDSRFNIWRYVEKLRDDGMAVFLTTHYLEEADELANNLAIMDHGKIVAKGTPQELKRQISGDVIIVKPKCKKTDLEKLLSLLNAQEPIDKTLIKESLIKDESIYIYVDNGSFALPIILDMFKEQEIVIDNISLSQPSLDDVFLKQTGRTLQDAGKEYVI